MTVRNFFMFSSFFACLLLTSCNLDDLFDKHSDSAVASTDGSISFSVGTPATKGGSSDGWQTVNVPLGSSGNASQSASSSVSTRGVPVTGTGAPSGSFGVFGYEIKSGTDISAATPSFMYNTQVTRSGSSGNYTFSYYPSKYWPTNGDNVRFFAYYPYKGNGITLPTNTSKGVPQITYSPSTVVSDQVDLMCSSTSDMNSGTVNMGLNHVLSRISFSVRKMAGLDFSTIKIQSIRLSGVKKTGTYALDGGSSWNLTNDTTSYTISTVDATLIPESSQSFNISDYLPVTTSTGYLMMLPQTLSSSNQIIVKYTVDGASQTAVINFPSTETSWTKGQSKNYQLNIGPFSNSYIINSSPVPTTFSFPIKRVNEYWGSSALGNNNSYVIGASDTWAVNVIWQDVNGLVSMVTNTGTGPNALATIQVPSNAKGNAVVGIKKTSGSGTGTYLWSWHLWVTDYNPKMKTNGTTYTSSNGLIWMDRNLGAVAIADGINNFSTCGGLFYQWGRKDPFPGSNGSTIGDATTKTTYLGTVLPGFSVGSSVNLILGIFYPNTFYGANDLKLDWCNNPSHDDFWNSSAGKKTVYDPCPAGWRVPALINAWTGLPVSLALTNSNTVTAYNNFQSYNYGNYPNNGFRDPTNGTLHNVGNRAMYWTAVPTSGFSYALDINSGSINATAAHNRAHGFNVRCVQEN